MSVYEHSACPYHSKRWRSPLQCIVNSLRQEGYIVGKHCRVLPRLVCTCPGKISDNYKVPDISQDTLVHWCQDVISSKSLPKKLLASVSQLYLATSQVTKEDGLIQVLTLLHLICQGQTSCLEPQIKQQATVMGSAAAIPSEPDPKTGLFYLDIPVTPTHYIGTLIGRGGIHLKELCQRYDILNIHLGEETKTRDTRTHRIYRRNARSSFIYNSPVKVTYQFAPSNEKGSLFEAELQKNAALVCEKREKHFQVVQVYRQTKRKRFEKLRQQRQDKADEEIEIEESEDHKLDFKVAAKVNYFHGKNKEHNRRGKPVPILADSHCLHCLQPFSTDTECRFHPGYIVVKKRKRKTFKAWSCCGRRYDIDTTAASEHTRTGCSTGRHIWRPHKTKKAKARVTSKDEEDIVVQ